MTERDLKSAAPRTREPNSPNSRRDFLRGILNKAGNLAAEEAQRHLPRAAPPFIRPPGAVQESEFLALCTQCGDCVTACPHDTVFLLSESRGVAAQTPALDLLQQACHLCEDFPCIAACEPEALRPVDVETVRFARIQIDRATCLPYRGPECGVCVAVCPVPGALILEGTLPVIDADVCTGCSVCRQACVVTPSAISVHPLAEDRVAEDRPPENRPAEE